MELVDTTDLIVPEQFAVVTADRWEQRRLTPPDQPIEVPAYLGADWLPDWKAIPPRTPKDEIRVATNEKTGAMMYKFVTSGYVLRTLDKVFRGHNWGYEIVREEPVDQKPNGEYEYVVVLQLVGPGMFRPVIGVGSSKFHPTNPQDTAAKTRAGAFTSALKNAAKQMGIGRDLDEDDPEFNKVVDGRTRTIGIMYDKLTERGMGEEAKAIIRKYADTAILESGQLLVGQIDFERLEPIQRELSLLAARATTVESK